MLEPKDLATTFTQALREAALFTTSPTVFVEEFLPDPKHLEVQFLGDNEGNVRIIGEPRDCSIQRRRQKIVEFTPPVGLDRRLAEKINEYSMRLLQGLDKPYVGAGTVEFLLPGQLGVAETPIFFTELNPRIQVEHTVTEMTTSVDLVLCQLAICLEKQSILAITPPEITSVGTAIQARVQLTPSTTPLAVLNEYAEPFGEGIRVDSGLAKGMKLSTDYDPLVLKLIVWSDKEEIPESTPEEKREGIVKKATTFEGARKKLVEALEGLVIKGDGIKTNIGYLKQLLTVEEFKGGDARTTLAEDDALDSVLWMLAGGDEAELDLESGALTSNPSEEELVPGQLIQVKSNIAGTVTSSNLDPSKPVRKGTPLLTLTSMKMESFVVAPADGYVAEPATGIGEVGKVIKVGDAVCKFRPAKLAPGQGDEVKPVETWDKEIAEIDARRKFALGMGGPKAVAAVKAAGRLNLRERIQLLLDEGTFFEFGRGAGTPIRDADGNVIDMVPGNFILGTGEINKRQVVVGGEDFTIQGGSPNLAGLRKSVYTETLALDLLCPLIRTHEGGGGSVGGADNRRDQAATQNYKSPPSAVFETPRFQSVAQCLTRVPVVSAAMGTVAGLPASRLAASHFTIMVANGNAQVLTAGPKVVERALGYSTTKFELGGVETHMASGVVDNFAKDEEDAIRQIRQFLSYLPQNIFELPPVIPAGPEPSPDQLAELNTIVPRSRRQTFDMRRVLNLVFDKDSFFEMGNTKFGETQITGLARLAGYPVCVMANDCKILAGAMTVDGAQKVTRFIEFAHLFRLPLITFVDEPGFDIGLEAERAGTIRWGTRAVLTAQNARIPWVSWDLGGFELPRTNEPPSPPSQKATVLARKLYGVAGAAHLAPKGYMLSWPSFESGALPLEAGVAVAFGKQIAAAADPVKARAEFEARFSRGLSPFPGAETFSQHELIKPDETRKYLIAWLKRSWPLLSRLDPISNGSFGYRG